MSGRRQSDRQQAADAEAAGLRARQLRVRLRARAALRRVVRHHRLRQPAVRSTEARVAVEQPDDSRTITIDFVTDLPSVGNWEFRPIVASMQVHPGRLYETEFIAHNLTGHDTTAQAVPNIAPGKAAGYFRKTECFCFTPQKFAVERSSGPWPCASWSIRRCRARSIASRFRTLSMTSSREWAH